MGVKGSITGGHWVWGAAKYVVPAVSDLCSPSVPDSDSQRSGAGSLGSLTNILFVKLSLRNSRSIVLVSHRDPPTNPFPRSKTPQSAPVIPPRIWNAFLGRGLAMCVAGTDDLCAGPGIRAPFFGSDGCGPQQHHACFGWSILWHSARGSCWEGEHLPVQTGRAGRDALVFSRS